MLCSVPTTRSSSNWLERLRSTRGIPTSAVDLDHFILNTPPTDANPSSDPSPAPTSILTASAATNLQPRSHSVHEIMTSILSDLFNMGGAEIEPILELRRSSRKQPNPRFLPSFQDKAVASSLDSRWEDERGKEGLEENVEIDEAEDEEEGGVADGKEEDELVGYSRSEVTVIDTSCEVWKFEKVVYRRKDVWKVRDRKGNGRGKMRKMKKRKAGGSGSDGRVAKRKVVESSNEGLKSAEEDERKLQNEMEVILNDASKGEARFSMSDSPTRKRNGGSSVVLVKGVPKLKIKKTKVLN